MQISILAVGKVREKYLLEGISDFSARIRPYVTCTITEIPDDRGGDARDDAKKMSCKREGERISKEIPGGSYVWVLDPAGKRYSSLSFAERLKSLSLDGPHKIVFIIGGPHGISEEVKKEADELLSLSPMTFSHEVARFLLLEQLYRAFRINRNEPYHK
ncbi:MAG: 23S rRNA (pseudouridine(1915)-N(3))-methyltransferase RlmH [Methanospirillaceae archaeon]|nr:23S rRNA (pseudouridine(1915)-N(3))-methyltransferase RlmH [Methanospirillaceae archaeon]